MSYASKVEELIAELDALRRQVAASKAVIAGQDYRAKLLGAEFSALCVRAADVAGEREANAILTEENDRLREALQLIAAPMRPDGTYNRDRRACELLARAALGEQCSQQPK